MKPGKIFIIFLICCLFFSAAGCTKVSEPEKPEPVKKAEEASESAAGKSVPEKEISAEEKIARAEAYGANELGQVMILEWHSIGSPEGRWQRTPENFRMDLETLYEKDYRLISLRDFVTGRIDIPGGMTPVVLTFDDGTSGHFRYLEDGEGNEYTDPDCAVGILADFAETHPDFGLEASFYIFGTDPFGQKGRGLEKTEKIIAMGMDVGNHSWTHQGFKGLSREETAEEIGKMSAYIEDNIENYILDSMALPFGVYPEETFWAVEGDWGNYHYENRALLKVGASPAESVFHEDFDPYHLPRIQVFQEEFDKWIGYFDNHPEKRFVSDGDPETVAYPGQAPESAADGGEYEKIVY